MGRRELALVLMLTLGTSGCGTLSDEVHCDSSSGTVCMHEDTEWAIIAVVAVIALWVVSNRAYCELSDDCDRG